MWQWQQRFSALLRKGNGTVTEALFSLDKWVWDQDDCAEMGWHDCRVHALALLDEGYELCLDIDYILAWVDPGALATHYSFWVAPATLVFANVFDLHIAIEAASASLNLQNIERTDEQPTPDGTFNTWRWTLDAREGDISFRASGYTQYVRRAPLHIDSQVLACDQRHGLSFARQHVIGE